LSSKTETITLVEGLKVDVAAVCGPASYGGALPSGTHAATATVTKENQAFALTPRSYHAAGKAW
jgi:hypothetical protein